MIPFFPRPLLRPPCHAIVLIEKEENQGKRKQKAGKSRKNPSERGLCGKKDEVVDTVAPVDISLMADRSSGKGDPHTQTSGRVIVPCRSTALSALA